MSPLQFEKMHQVLDDAPAFQREFGDEPQTLASVTFPDSSWHGLVLKGWKFQNVVFEGTKFDSVVFEDAVFEGCEFRAAELTNVEFRNCKLGGILMRGGKWVGNRFQGGELHGFDSRNEIGFRRSGTWARNRFDSFHLHDNHPGDDAAAWEDCVFTDSRIENNDFGEPWDDFRQDLEGKATAIVGATFERCSFKGNNWRGTLGTGTIRQCEMDGDDFGSFEGNMSDSRLRVLRGMDLSGDIRDCRFESEGQAEGFSISGGRDIVAKGFKDGAIVEDTRNLDFEGLQEGTLHVRGSNQGLRIHGIRAKNFILTGEAEDAVFEDIQVRAMTFDGFHGKRSRFKDLEITQEIAVSLKPEDAATFEECTFENVRRAPGAIVYEYVDEPLQGHVLPWESEPGVPKAAKP
ncbi:MAG: pentapeptide repeat-containing protein [Fibrobacteria bacterium]|nr:pentapeptide repeat-containing protein [Fibrobacteria bacterium]